jgi:cytochrome d ubiquinol oxidase subunit I
LYTTEKNAAFSILTIGSLDGSKEVWSIKIPGLTSILAGKETVKGINDIKSEYAKDGYTQGDGSQNALQKEFADKLKTMNVNPTPNIPVSYWSFRIMMGLGFLAMAIGAWMLWVTRKGATPKAGKLWTAMMFGLPLLPLFANSFGWIFTEMGRQPWIVAGVIPTALAVSPTVTVGEIWFTMIVYTLLYGGLAVIELGLLFKYIKKGLPDVAPVEQIVDEDAPLSFAY